MKIHHIALTVKNLEESKQFYQNLFGFVEVRSFERPDLQGKAIFMSCENTMLELWEFANGLPYQDEPLHRMGIRHIAFETKNIQEFIDKIPKEIITVDIVRGSSGSQFCFISDPSGIDIEIYEPV